MTTPKRRLKFRKKLLGDKFCLAKAKREAQMVKEQEMKIL